MLRNASIFRKYPKHHARSPPEHFAIGYVHNDNLPRGNIAHNIQNSKQLQEGLMMFSDDFLHFLKIKNFFCRIHPNYLVALMPILISTLAYCLFFKFYDTIVFTHVNVCYVMDSQLSFIVEMNTSYR